MNKELDNMEFISDEFLNEDIEKNIEDILEKGLKEKRGFFRFLNSAKNDLGLKNIFIDKSELIFIGLIFIITITLFGLHFNKSIDGNSEFIYKFKLYNFIVAPIVYFIICSYSFINSKLNGTYEIQATCKYNFYNITAIRMFIFSIASILINMAIILAMFLFKRNFNFIEIFIISASSLFIFSVFYISILIYLKKIIYKYIAIIVWILGLVIIFSGVNNYWGKLFLEMPIYIHLSITITFIIAYIKNLTKLMSVKKGEI